MALAILYSSSLARNTVFRRLIGDQLKRAMRVIISIAKMLKTPIQLISFTSRFEARTFRLPG